MDLLKDEFEEFESTVSKAFEDALLEKKSLHLNDDDIQQPTSNYVDICFKGERKLLDTNVKNMEEWAYQILKGKDDLKIKSIVDKVNFIFLNSIKIRNIMFL